MKKTGRIDTPCGFEIAIARMDDGTIKQWCYFNNSPVSLTNTHYRLSREGALQYAKLLQEVCDDA